MGRILHEGALLVDMKETMEILGKSRASVNRLMASGALDRRKVPKDKKAYVTMASIQLVAAIPSGPGQMAQMQAQVRELSERQEPERMKYLRKWHPNVFT